MAGALEVAKLVTASYLHNNWKRAGWMKWYLSLAVVILMVITSLGIYGFLTSAYQTTADQLGIVEKQVKVIELKKDRFQEQLDYYNIEKSNLTKSKSKLKNNEKTVRKIIKVKLGPNNVHTILDSLEIEH